MIREGLMRYYEKKGLAFIIVLVFVLVIALLGGAVSFLINNEIGRVRIQNDSTRALFLAEAGCENAKAQLENSWSDTTSLVGISLGEGTYDADFYNTDSQGAALPSNKKMVVSTGTVNGRTRTVEIVLESTGIEDGSANVTCAIETEGGLNVQGSADIDGDVREATNTTLSAGAGVSDVVLSVGDTTDFRVGDTVSIDSGGANEETGKIASIDGGASTITLENGVSFAHSSGTAVDRILSFEDVFGVTKTEMEAIAQSQFPSTYYTSAIHNDVVTGLTWISAPGTESQITTNTWSGDGVLVVEGDLQITGGDFSGIIWVEGVLRISGNPDIEGGIFVESGISVDTTVTGNAEIDFDGDAVSDAFSYLTSLSVSTDYWRELD